MRKCPACGTHFEGSERRCPACGGGVLYDRGAALYSQEPAEGEGGFEVSYFAELAAKEAGNFWFRARNRLIVWALGAYCPGFGSFLEIGCGTGFVLSGVSSRFPTARLHGSDLYLEGLAFAMGRLPSAEFMRMDARSIPFFEEFEVVGAFDVLEHMDEDVLALTQIHGALRPRGTLLLTVPQHAWMWSPLDDSARHKRRYGKAELRSKVEAAGFSVVRSTSFVFTLLPLMFLSRLAARRKPPGQGPRLPEIGVHPWLDRLFDLAMAFDILLIRAGISLPVGGSRLLVARKRPSPAGDSPTTPG